ncbi:MAG: magnesium/cobalt transporter CorA [Burkholderiaceae bacterium]
MLINCVVYSHGLRVRDIPIESIPEALADPDNFLWVALRDPPPDEVLRMQAVLELPALAVEDVLHGGQRPKIEEYDDLLFVILRLIEPHDHALREGELYVFVGPRFTLSIRTRCEQNMLDVRARAEREPELLNLGPGYVLYALTDAVVDRYFPVIDELETELEVLEERIFSGTAGSRIVQDLYSLKQRVTQLRHAISPLIEAMNRLNGGRVPAITSGLQEYFRDVHDHLYRILESLDAVRDSIAMAMQVNLSLITTEQSEINKRLAAYAAIFAVMTTLAGIWGMNFEHMPELRWTYGYPVALVLMIGIAIVLWWRFRKAGWLGKPR